VELHGAVLGARDVRGEKVPVSRGDIIPDSGERILQMGAGTRKKKED
jgi:hypothetical protein